MTKKTLAHTTDLSGDDGLAFVHAAALAAQSGARLVTIHGNPAPDAAARLPAASPLAARWGRTIDHERRCHECCDDVTDTVLDALRRLDPALVVAGTHARHGFRAFLHESVSAALARNLAMPTLIVPNRGRGFVDEATGAIDLRRILVPAADAATAEVGVNAARQLCALAGTRAPELIVLHVGDGDIIPPKAEGLAVHMRYARGRLEDEIREIAREDRVCAIAMATRGHDGMLDALLGSNTEHVLHDAACPVMVAPMARGHAILET
jgi:nucleotide-binding universal stress UspA family protein